MANLIIASISSNAKDKTKYKLSNHPVIDNLTAGLSDDTSDFSTTIDAALASNPATTEQRRNPNDIEIVLSNQDSMSLKFDDDSLTNTVLQHILFRSPVNKHIKDFDGSRPVPENELDEPAAKAFFHKSNATGRPSLPTEKNSNE